MGEFIAAEQAANSVEGGTFCTRNISELQTEPVGLGSNTALPHSVT